jgi:hypothetical protein
MHIMLGTLLSFFLFFLFWFVKEKQKKITSKKTKQKKTKGIKEKEMKVKKEGR